MKIVPIGGRVFLWLWGEKECGPVYLFNSEFEAVDSFASIHFFDFH